MYDGKAKTFEERLDTFIDAGEKIVEYLDMRKNWKSSIGSSSIR